MRKITMNKSYRNTVQIASYAAQFSSDPDVELLERQGKEVEVRQFQKEDDLLEAILEAVRAGEERFETAAVLDTDASGGRGYLPYLEIKRSSGSI